jgi:5-methyltetrahydropteroyltriglutamate--homocysteine methyltransferase
MWVGGITKGHYADKLEMGEDVVRILHEELVDLAAAGCEFVQFDEPVLTEIVLSEANERRTFM